MQRISLRDVALQHLSHLGNGLLNAFHLLIDAVNLRVDISLNTRELVLEVLFDARNERVDIIRLSACRVGADIVLEAIELVVNLSHSHIDLLLDLGGGIIPVLLEVLLDVLLEADLHLVLLLVQHLAQASNLMLGD